MCTFRSFMNNFSFSFVLTNSLKEFTNKSYLNDLKRACKRKIRAKLKNLTIN